ncbi:MAG TPA: hypothetical protein PKD26_04560 [Pyrinomonadaceae bacterium]|nr:hypothetical protein [Pyrinomonadaceae bacterium]
MVLHYLVKRILWVDCVGAIATGFLLLFFSWWIAPLYGLPQWFVVGHAFVHLAYGSYSFSLAVRKTRPMPLIETLAIANGVWGSICLILALYFVSNATAFAVVHFLLEGIYVGSLGFIEWNRRESLAKGL